MRFKLVSKLNPIGNFFQFLVKFPTKYIKQIFMIKYLLLLGR